MLGCACAAATGFPFFVHLGLAYEFLVCIYDIPSYLTREYALFCKVIDHVCMCTSDHFPLRITSIMNVLLDDASVAFPLQPCHVVHEYMGAA